MSLAVLSHRLAAAALPAYAAASASLAERPLPIALRTSGHKIYIGCRRGGHGESMDEVYKIGPKGWNADRAAADLSGLST